MTCGIMIEQGPSLLIAAQGQQLHWITRLSPQQTLQDLMTILLSCFFQNTPVKGPDSIFLFRTRVKWYVHSTDKLFDGMDK